MFSIKEYFADDDIPEISKSKPQYQEYEHEQFFREFQIPFMIAHFDHIRCVMVDVNGEGHELDLFHEMILQDEINNRYYIFDNAINLDIWNWGDYIEPGSEWIEPHESSFIYDLKKALPVAIHKYHGELPTVAGKKLLTKQIVNYYIYDYNKGEIV